MPHSIPNDWLSEPPRLLVVGSGPYANCLAQVLGAAQLALECLEGGPKRNEGGGYPRVFDHLETVFLIIPAAIAPAEALWQHHWVWDWIEKLTLGKEFHEVAIIFVLGAGVPASFDNALATSLAVVVVDSAICGHAIWRSSGKLPDLLKLSHQSIRKDFQALRNRRSLNVQGKSLRALAEAALSDADSKVWSSAINAVADAFRNGNNYLNLDLFCVPPCHQNGHLFRQWLHAAVTEPVTPDIKRRARELISLIRTDVLNV